MIPTASRDALTIVQQAALEGWTDWQVISKIQRLFPRILAEFDTERFCIQLNCSGANILALPLLSRLKLLNCAHCWFLESLPDMPSLEKLDCQTCLNLKGLPEMPNLQSLVCTDCTSLVLPYNCRSEAVAQWIKPWQEQDLMPCDADGRILFWKCVSRERKGNLGFRYKLGQEFENTGMVCAGPLGALKDYDKYRATGSRVMAIWATCLYPVNLTKGIFHVLRGTPAALYLARDINEEGFIPLFLDGDEDEHIERVLYGEEDLDLALDPD